MWTDSLGDREQETHTHVVHVQARVCDQVETKGEEGTDGRTTSISLVSSSCSSSIVVNVTLHFDFFVFLSILRKKEKGKRKEKVAVCCLLA